MKAFVLSIFFLASCSWFREKPAEPNKTLEISKLQNKVKRQFDLYDKAKTYFMEHLAENKLVSRADLDAELDIRRLGEESFDEKELDDLRKEQLERIAIAKNSYEKSSFFDLDKIRSHPHKLKEFCRDVPKGGLLHVHASGTLNEQTLRKMLEQLKTPIKKLDFISIFEKSGNEEKANRAKKMRVPESFLFSDLSESQKEDILSFYFYPTHPASFDRDFQPLFSLVEKTVLTDPNLIEILFKDFIDGVHATHGQLVEFDWSRAAKPQFRDLVQKIIEYGRKHDVLVFFKVAFYRSAPESLIREDLDKFLKSHDSSSVKGVDLMGSEEGNDALEKGQYILTKVNLYNKNHNPDKKLLIAIHAGEFGSKKNPRDAAIMGAEHLGHGVLLWEDVLTTEYLARRKNIMIDINVSSNYYLNFVPDITKHPFLNYYRLGIPISLSTDDPGMFRTDMNTECELILTKSDITYEEWKNIANDSIEYSAASFEEKQKILSELKKSFLEFEKTHKF